MSTQFRQCPSWYKEDHQEFCLKLRKLRMFNHAHDEVCAMTDKEREASSTYQRREKRRQRQVESLAANAVETA